MEAAGIAGDLDGPLLRPLGKDRKGFSQKHLCRKDILGVVKNRARAADVDVDRIDSRGVGVHSLQKTTITNALNNDAPMHLVQALAGHTDIRTTQGYSMRKDSDAETALAAPTRAPRGARVGAANARHPPHPRPERPAHPLRDLIPP